MKKLHMKLSLLILLLIGVICVTTTSIYAWYLGYVGLDPKTDEIRISANSTYYAAGNGTKENPYIITKPRHLYNLAWLQDLGYYDETKDSDTSTSEIDPFYFELGANLDMSELKRNGVQTALPPIGIDEHPFVANFNGNGYVISNLLISTDFANQNYIKPSTKVLDEHSETYLSNTIQTSYLGTFGYVGSKTKGTTLSTEVTNFTIAKARVNTTNNVLAGFIAGYADNDLSKIGVYYSNFDFSSNVGPISGYSFVSSYGLVGDYNYDDDKISWEDRPTSGGVGYGTSTDIHELYTNLGGIDGNSIGKLEAYPFRAKNGTKVNPSASQISMNLSSGTKNVYASKTQEAVTTGNNIGYYVGSDIKVYNKPSGVDYSKFYYPGDSAYSQELPSNGHNAPSEEIVEYLTKTQTDSEGNTYKNGDYLIRMTGNSQLDTNNEGGLTVVENARVGSWTGNLLVPIRCIWVAPVKAGTFKFVLMNIDNSSMGFRLYKLKRSEPGNYSSYFSQSSYPLEFNNLLLAKKAYYFEVEVTQEDVEAGYEYALSAGDGYHPYLSYIDIGAVGGTTSSVGIISNIDFVYSTNTTSGYNEINENTLSGVGFKITGTSTSEMLIYIFRSEANGVQYVVSGSGMSVTSFGKSASKKDSTSDFE